MPYMPNTQISRSTSGYFLNVKNYGAVGDGTHDDTSAIQGTITAASSSGNGVYFPGGTYIVDGLSVPAQVVLQGVNGISYLKTPQPPISRLKLKAASANHLIINDDTGVDSTGVQIRDLMLDTNSLAKSAIYLADEGSSVPRFWFIERCLIVNSGYSSGSHGAAVYIGNFNTGCVMRDCQVVSNAAGAVTQHVAGWDGISWYGSDGLCEDTYIAAFADAGFYVQGGTADITLLVRGGGSFWCDTGVVVGGHGLVLSDYSIDHNYNDGIYAAYPFKAIGCTFHSNSVQTNNQWAHINLAASTATGSAVIACRQAPQDADAGANLCKYFLQVAAGALVTTSGNHQAATATLGTAWTDYVGTYSAPAFPASTVAVTNTSGVDVQAFITNGTSAITVITLGSTTPGMTIAANGTGTIKIPYGQKVAFTYAGGSPAWTWVAG